MHVLRASTRVAHTIGARRMLSSAGTVGFVGLGKMGYNMVRAAFGMALQSIAKKQRDHGLLLRYAIGRQST